MKNIYEGFTNKMAAKASWHQNYVTVTLCVSRSCLRYSRQNRSIAAHDRGGKMPREGGLVQGGGKCPTPDVTGLTDQSSDV